MCEEYQFRTYDYSCEVFSSISRQRDFSYAIHVEPTNETRVQYESSNSLRILQEGRGSFIFAKTIGIHALELSFQVTWISQPLVVTFGQRLPFLDK